MCVDANDPLRLARFWASALGWQTSDDTSGAIALVPNDGTRFQIHFLPVPEKKAGKNRIHLDLTTTSTDDMTGRSSGSSSSAPDMSTSARAQTNPMSSWPIPKATSSASSSRTTPFWPAADASGRSPATVRGRWGTSGVERSDGRWSGIRTRRPPFACRTAPARSSPGARHFPRSSRRTGFISTSLRSAPEISGRRSTVSYPWVRLESTSAKETSDGWSWPTQMATSSACVEPR